MNTTAKAFERKNEMLHITLKGGLVRVLLADTTLLTQEAADIHGLTPVATAAIGRLLTGTAMLCADMKDENTSVTVQFKGGGPMGTLCAVGHGGELKAYADNPQVVLPLKENGKLDVGGAVGKEGHISVIRDAGFGEPYVGRAELMSGEIAEDFAAYFTLSEQQPSIVSLGVLVSGEAVLAAGGILIQPLPGCPDEVLDELELRSPLFQDISREMTFAPIEELMQDWFRDMEPVILSKKELSYRCGCSRERMEKALIALGKKELQEMIADGNGAELTCHFCRNRFSFDTANLKTLLEQATRD
jgi:Disulfide bond chaperones of the HSP33 family